jgi:hypothetical protein
MRAPRARASRCRHAPTATTTSAPEGQRLRARASQRTSLGFFATLPTFIQPMSFCSAAAAIAAAADIAGNRVFRSTPSAARPGGGSPAASTASRECATSKPAAETDHGYLPLAFVLRGNIEVGFSRKDDSDKAALRRWPCGSRWARRRRGRGAAERTPQRKQGVREDIGWTGGGGLRHCLAERAQHRGPRPFFSFADHAGTTPGGAVPCRGRKARPSPGRRAARPLEAEVECDSDPLAHPVRARYRESCR